MELDIYDWRDFPGRGQAPVFAGTLRRCGLTGHHIFRYSKIWLRHGSVLGPLDPMFPLDGKPHDIGHSCSGLIGDALPEKWGRTALSRLLEKPDVQDMDCMAIPDSGRPGSLDFARKGSPLAALPPHGNGLKRILSVAMSLDRGSGIPRTRGNIMALMWFSSLGGSRPKFPFTDSKGAQWLAKMPAAADRWEDTRIEGAMLDLAKACGIEAADHHLAEIEGVPILFVRRFDRDGSARIPFMSAQSMLEGEETHYRSMSYPKLARALSAMSRGEDARALFTRMAFNILVRNTDDHSRNHAMIKKDGAWRLSPAYDIIPTVWALDMRQPAFHSMSIGHHGNRGSRENALSMCGEFGYSPEDAEREWDRVAGVLSGSWEQALEKAGVSRKDSALVAPIFRSIRVKNE